MFWNAGAVGDSGDGFEGVGLGDFDVGRHGVFLLGVVVGLVVEVEGATKHGVHEVFGGEHLVEGGFIHEAFF